jgi:site-specific DNA-methyltransferase (adenine-specific)
MAKVRTTPPAGRWPANVIHDGSDEVVGLFPQTGLSKGVAQFKTHTTTSGARATQTRPWSRSPATEIGYGDTGSAARFFYCAKASKADRDEGCEGLGSRFAPTMGNGIGDKEHDPDTATPKRNHHPTVKPTALMRYLCRLVTPPGGVVLDPFMGSGSTGKAAILEGFRFIGIEREAEYVEIARARIGAVLS